MSNVDRNSSSSGYRFVLLGKTGSGKSAAGNTILGQKAFTSKKSSVSVTQKIQVEHAKVCGVLVTVYDTPGFFDTEINNELITKRCQDVLSFCDSGSDICTYLLVIKSDRFTEEERKTVQKIEEMLGEDRMKKTWILFTRGDELEEEDLTIEDFINQTAELKQLVHKYRNRYHVFNNKIKESEQVTNLMKKVNRNLLQSAPHLCRIIPPNTDKKLTSISSSTSQRNTVNPRNVLQSAPPAECGEDDGSSRKPQKIRRIVLLGKSGNGKSATGNTILGAEYFKSKFSLGPVTSKSEVHQARVEDWNVSVVDTPSLFDTNLNPEELATEIAEFIRLSSPGPHAFLIVLPINQRFTPQDKEIIQMIKALFGEEVMKYTTILFTHGDQLEDQNPDHIINQNEALSEVLAECGGGYQVFNNKDQRDREQVTALLQKIDRVVEENGGTYYTNQMFQDAARFREKEEKRERIGAAAKRERQKKDEEIKQIKIEIEQRIREKYQEKMKINEEMEKLLTPDLQPANPSHWKNYGKYILIGLGALSGAAICSVVGTAGAVGAAGAAVGHAVGGSVGAAVSAAGGAVGTVGGVVGGVVGAAVGAAVDRVVRGAANVNH